MKKIAIFVEGLTEEIFVIELIKAIAGGRGITFELKAQNFGLLHTVSMFSNAPIGTDSEYYFLIVNCNNDQQVKSQIKKQHQSLAQNGYTAIIGLRDVYPYGHADLPNLRSANYAGLPVAEPQITVVLAVLEVEAWFLAEVTHFAKLHPDMTPENIANAGNDLINISPEAWHHPAETLKIIYKNWKLNYRKTRNHILRTVNALDFGEMYVSARGRSNSLHEFISSIEDAMFPKATT